MALPNPEGGARTVPGGDGYKRDPSTQFISLRSSHRLGMTEIGSEWSAGDLRPWRGDPRSCGRWSPACSQLEPLSWSTSPLQQSRHSEPEERGIKRETVFVTDAPGFGRDCSCHPEPSRGISSPHAGSMGKIELQTPLCVGFPGRASGEQRERALRCGLRLKGIIDRRSGGVVAQFAFLDAYI
jgi:hypothetical protein